MNISADSNDTDLPVPEKWSLLNLCSYWTTDLKPQFAISHEIYLCLYGFSVVRKSLKNLL